MVSDIEDCHPFVSLDPAMVVFVSLPLTFGRSNFSVGISPGGKNG
ncbi:MAG TPA: hypothetical protein VIO58_02425 [Candidatus Methanoperedens sp.]